jgi:hypothetical protein
MVMLCGRSQHKENLQGDVLILQQISALRRDLPASRKIGLRRCGFCQTETAAISDWQMASSEWQAVL